MATNVVVVTFFFFLCVCVGGGGGGGVVCVGYSFFSWETIHTGQQIQTLYCHFWNLSCDILRLSWQPPSSAWAYVSDHYDHGGTRTCDPVKKKKKKKEEEEENLRTPVAHNSPFLGT